VGEHSAGGRASLSGSACVFRPPGAAHRLRQAIRSADDFSAYVCVTGVPPTSLGCLIGLSEHVPGDEGEEGRPRSPHTQEFPPIDDALLVCACLLHLPELGEAWLLTKAAWMPSRVRRMGCDPPHALSSQALPCRRAAPHAASSRWSTQQVRQRVCVCAPLAPPFPPPSLPLRW